MKRILKIFLFSIILIFLLSFDVQAETSENLSQITGVYKLSENLPDEVNDIIKDLGIENNDISSVNNLTFGDVLGVFANKASDEAGNILPSVCVVLSLLLLYSLFVGVFESVSNTALSAVLSVVSSLCIACVLLMPVTKLISDASNAISISADFMLSYIPVMIGVLVSEGFNVTAGGYSAMMIVTSEAVGQYFSKFISPLLSCFLSLGISSSIVPDVNLSGLLSFFSKTVKWLMSFVFTIFTGVLTLKSLFSSSVDNVSSRAVRYTMSSFVPVVGGALSEAYRAVHGSVGVLKSGVGVFVIIAVISAFLPVMVKLLIWVFTLNMCKTFAEVTSLNSPLAMLTSISMVLSLLLSVIFCVIALFVVTTALIMTIGGAV